ncbi:MAG: tRNA uridine-5-carboxymethylaminomethyl(34) synthesis GTPase MnmE [Oscillospiraceae bacterium]|nr:tRNA uridine-5-carboxymethylaminomethyl(34) synthesis GTPase MnmE [Oscillospiraceae bacterium]
MNTPGSDTIAAPATAAAPSAVGIVRISGSGAFAAADALFFPRGGAKASGAPARRAVTGEVRTNGALLDTGLLLLFPAPRSYTGEDVAELQLHGSPAVLAAVMGELARLGVRPAAPGEFTKRAFLNGRLDLAQAEAVADIITAPTEVAARAGAAMLAGARGESLRRECDELTGLLAHFTALVDYPEEDLPPADAADMARRLFAVSRRLERLQNTYEEVRLINEGLACAIIGRPNAGKSSLLNALAGADRVIVSPEPGTTRDIVEQRVTFGGALLRLQDSAGLREAGCHAEREGASRALEAANLAHAVLRVFDGSQPPDAQDEAVWNAAKGRRAFTVVNKCDLPLRFEPKGDAPVFYVSALTGEGIDRLREALSALPPRPGESEGAVLASARQADAAARAADGAACAARALTDGVTPDAVLGELEYAIGALGEVLGLNVSEEVLRQVFERFCVGK